VPVAATNRHSQRCTSAPPRSCSAYAFACCANAAKRKSQERQRLQRCLDALEPPQRSAVREAFFFTGATYNELAARCKVPLGTMKSWIRRSLLQLRTCLER
jgi:DNA-directed RNA polymerase specialized sigma24 family protein